MNNSKIRQNFFTLDFKKYTETNTLNIKKVVEILNKDRLVVITGLKNTGKLNFIKEFINKTNSNNNYFYFNKSEDIENNIIDNISLFNLLNDYIKLYKLPNYIILQNISKIEGIKEFIGQIYKSNYKIILVGNNISIGGIQEVEILNDTKIDKENLNTVLKYGSLNEIKQLETTELKEKFLQLLTNDIFLNDIFIIFGVKSIELYNFTISYIANNNIFLSLRELQKNLDNTNNISLKTTIDYIDFSIQAKILKRVYKYDLKTNKQITSKAKYYFTDNGIRNSLTNFKLSNEILTENLIFNKLQYNNFNIYSGLNGKFEFNFYAKPLSCPQDTPTANFSSPSLEKEATLYIHISKQNKKDDVKKEVNKLLKIGNEGIKYLLVDSIEKLGIKKVKYESVNIIEIEDFLEKFGQ